MTEVEDFNLAEEFAAASFHKERLEKRFRRTMETPAKDPGKKQSGLAGKTIRSTEGQPVIPVLQDTVTRHTK